MVFARYTNSTQGNSRILHPVIFSAKGGCLVIVIARVVWCESTQLFTTFLRYGNTASLLDVTFVFSMDIELRYLPTRPMFSPL